MSVKRIGSVFAATAAQLAGAYATKRFASRAMVLNTDTGEIRVGPGVWGAMKPLTAGAATEVVAATTANITIATALNNGDTLDGVVLATGDLVLVKNQSTASANGIYVVGASPARAAAFDTWGEHVGALVRVLGGTTNANAYYRCNVVVGGTLNTNDIGFDLVVTNTMNLAGLNQWDNLPTASAAGVTSDETLLLQRASGQLVTITLAELKTYTTT